MATALHLDILDLRHYSARQLRPLLEAESREWSTLLRWDYRSSADLLLQYLDSRVLPGFVALDRGRICGYVFCVYEGNKAVIGDVYATPAANGSQPACEVENRLICHMLEMLQHSPNVDRIESQLLLHPSGMHVQPFLNTGFHIFPRLFMERDVSDHKPLMQGGHAAPSLPGDLVLRKWTAADFQSAGELIARCYHGHTDSRINNQYRSIIGSLRFLHNIVRFPGCGVFDPEASWVLATPTGSLDGLLLCSRVREDVAHITQICVSPKYRRMGLSKLLLHSCEHGLRERNFQAITLTVTESNTSAVLLYQDTGFHIRHTFDAMVWDPAGFALEDAAK